VSGQNPYPARSYIALMNEIGEVGHDPERLPLCPNPRTTLLRPGRQYDSYQVIALAMT
jgi:hypothetical protein